MATSLGAGRPPTACQSCRHSKVRCSGEVPCCKRCSRSQLVCAYPRNARRCSPGEHQRAQYSASSPRSKDRQSRTYMVPLRQNHLNPLQSPEYLGLPDSIISILIDTYFDYCHNSRLLLHPAKLHDDRERGAIRPHILLAVCAMGATLYQDNGGTACYEDFAPVWAERSGKLMLNEIETPHEGNIVTSVILALFWHMRGSWRRSHIHIGNAMQTAHILNLISDTGKGKNPFERELSRRRFWACYLINCHISDSLFAISTPTKLANLLLPWREEEFERMVPEGPQATFSSRSSNGGIHSELIRALSLWSSVGALTKSTPQNSQERIASIHQLDENIRRWWNCVPTDLHVTSETLPRFSSLDLPNVVLLNIAYHQCLCALHASVVPLFAWGEDVPECALAKQFSAQVAYENACAISKILGLVTGRTVVSRLSSFVGYAAYCSYAVQIPFMWCTDDAVREVANNNTNVNCLVIRNVGRHWKSVALLEKYASFLTKIHSNNQVGLDAEPKGLDPSKLRGLRITVARARDSILSINGMLWNEDGYALQGDEMSDVNPNCNLRYRSPEGLACNRPGALHLLEPVDDPSLVSRDDSAAAIYDTTTVALHSEQSDISNLQAPVFFQPLVHTPDMFNLGLDGSFGFQSCGGEYTENSW